MGKAKRGKAMMIGSIAYLIVALVVVIFLSAAIRILREYQRGVVFTLGRFTGVKGPGLIILVPFVQQMVKVDLRVVVQDVPPQDVISRDNVSVKVNAVLYFRIVDAERAIIQVEDYMAATNQLAQTTLRSVLGKHELDEMLAERDRLNSDIQEILDQRTDAWGIKVSNVEIKHVDLNESMVRAIAKQAEAERLRRAKVINADGEQQAVAKLVEAGRMLAAEPQAMQLRYFEALHDIAGDIAEKVRARVLDIGIVEGEDIGPGLEAVKLAEDEMYVAAAAGHPLAELARIKPSLLERETWLVRERGSGTRAAADNLFASLGIQPVRMMELGSTQSIKETVEAGLGISLLSRWALRKELGLGSLKPLRAEGLPFRRSFHILFRRGDLRTRTVEAFLETLRGVTDEMLTEDNRKRN